VLHLNGKTAVRNCIRGEKRVASKETKRVVGVAYYIYSFSTILT
jgi:hypothetical protein